MDDFVVHQDLQNVLQLTDLLHALECGPSCAMPCKPVREHWLTVDLICRTATTGQ